MLTVSRPLDCYVGIDSEITNAASVSRWDNAVMLVM